MQQLRRAANILASLSHNRVTNTVRLIVEEDLREGGVRKGYLRGAGVRCFPEVDLSPEGGEGKEGVGQGRKGLSLTQCLEAVYIMTIPRPFLHSLNSEVQKPYQNTQYHCQQKGSYQHKSTITHKV